MTANPGSATAPAATAQIGVTGSAVMGRNLARNVPRNGFTVAVHNRSYARTESLMADHASEGNFVASESLEDFVASLVRPRTVVSMLQAGKAPDPVLSALIPLLEAGEYVVVAGTATFLDTPRPQDRLREHGLHFVGA